MKWLLLKLFDLPDDAFDGVDEWTLRLTGMPRNLWVLMGLVAAFGFLGWLTIRCYRREGRTPPLVKGILAGLRGLVFLVLLLVLLQPSLEMQYKKTLTSEVAVLIDDSLSMRWADRYGEEKDRAALAAFLGSKPDAFGGATRMPRLEIVRQALDRRGGVLARIAKEHPVSLFRFGVGGGSGNYTEMLAGASSEDRDARSALARIQGSGYETNIGRAVRETLEKLEGRRLAAIVLISDGQNTSATAAGRLASARNLLKERGVPVYCVAVGDPTPPKNVAVAQLQGPGDVRKGSTATFTAFLTNRHYSGAEVNVELHRAPVGSDQWEKASVAEKVKLAGDGAEEAGKLQEVTLRADVSEVGEYVYKAVVPAMPDEMITTDNEAKTTVRVSDEKVSILLISGDGGWEYQYLRNYLLRHPEHYKVSVWQQNADPAFNQESSTGMKLLGLPMTQEDLYKYDVILLYDPREGSGMDSGFVNLLEQFVGDHHGGLLYIVGNKFTDKNVMGGGPFAPLGRLLPVELGREAGGISAQLRTARTSKPIEVTPEGIDHPMMQLGITGEETRKAWESLPGVFRSHAVARLKTVASALAVLADNTRQTTDGQREPLVAVQYYGKGRVLYHGFDATWRWRLVDDLKIYQKYWANVIDFLAAGRLQKKRILITTGGDVFDAGTEIRVRVEAYSRDFKPMEGKTFTVSMIGSSGKPTDHVLQSTKPGFFEGAVLADRTGEFQVKAKANASGGADWLDEDAVVKRIEVRLPEEEFRRPEANFQVLRELAGEDSRFMLMHEIDQLPGKIPPSKLQSVLKVPRAIWRTWFFLGIVGLLLIVEWVVRKFYNMV